MKRRPAHDFGQRCTNDKWMSHCQHVTRSRLHTGQPPRHPLTELCYRLAAMRRRMGVLQPAIEGCVFVALQVLDRQATPAPQSQSRSASSICASAPNHAAVWRVRSSGAQSKRGAVLKRLISTAGASPVFSTGSFVGKHANFCATVRAWHINIKRVVCTGSAPVGHCCNHGHGSELSAIVP